tara:strand:+ start:1198 stop:1485 length:288 start_codon:yes stop_codon:yes gene_type:complete
MLLLIIKVYRLTLKKFIRSACLFEPSCSHHVENQYKSKGAKAGWSALFKRFKDCRPGYHYIEIDNEQYLITTNGNSYRKEELSETLQKELETILK